MKMQTYPARVRFNYQTGLLEISNGGPAVLFFTAPQFKHVLLAIVLNVVKLDRKAYDMAIDRIRQFLR